MTTRGESAILFAAGDVRPLVVVEAGSMVKTLIPDAGAVQLRELSAEGEVITLVVAAAGATACCPVCGQGSSRVHSRYRRTRADLPWQGRAVRLALQVRRWFCPNPACARQIFAERLPTVAAPYARRTARLAHVVEALALALGGAGGARLLATLGVLLRPDALLDAIRQAVRPTPPVPRVIGIDDWSWRRGHRFGTILVDLERHAVVALLPARAVDSTVAWLREHPEVTTIARDRAGVYAEAAAQGAPQARQVADRWHLLHNLGAVLEEFLLHQRAALRAAALPSTAGEGGVTAPDAAAEATAPGPLTPHRPRRNQGRPEEARRRRHARVVEQYAAIRRLHAAGAAVAASARRVGTSRRTVYRYRHLPAPPEPKRPHRPPRQRVLTPYEPSLLQRWQEGGHNGMRRYREIRGQGYAYGAANVMRFVAQVRRDEATDQPAGAARRAQATRVPSARRVAGLFLRRPADLHPEQQAYLDRLHQADTAVAAAYRLAQEFAAMARERGGTRLEAWLAEVAGCDAPALRRFATGLRADLEAARAGLTESWSNGPTEGFVHKRKLVKRQAYGRAGFAVCASGCSSPRDAGPAEQHLPRHRGAPAGALGPRRGRRPIIGRRRAACDAPADRLIPPAHPSSKGRETPDVVARRVPPRGHERVYGLVMRDVLPPASSRSRGRG